MQIVAMTVQEREAAEESEDNNWDGRPNKLPQNAAPGASDTDRVRSRHNRSVPGMGDHVAVYRDLSGAPKSGFEPHDAFSVKRASPGGGRKPLVVSHTTGVHLTNVRPVFDEAARQKAMQTGKRAVHAYTHGQVDHYIAPDAPKPSEADGWKRVNYYPDLGHFFLPDHGRVAYHGSDEAILHHGQQFVRGNIKTGTEPLPMSDHEPGGKYYKPKTGLLGRLFKGNNDHDGWVVDGDFARPKLAHVAHPRDGIRTYAMSVIAHDSGDGETVYHCPFCGSGQVIGRSDGTIECSFCLNNFTVQVQPQMGAMPQTIDGQPQQVPGMPGGPANDVPDPDDADADDDAIDMDPEEDLEAPDDDPEDADAGGSQPPWLKGSSRRTAEYGRSENVECGNCGSSFKGDSEEPCPACGSTKRYEDNDRDDPRIERAMWDREYGGREDYDEDHRRASKQYLTESGVLSEDAYIKRLAIQHADDPTVVLEQIRVANGG